MQAALARHDVILRQAIENHHGSVFKTVGDAFYTAFCNASETLHAAAGRTMSMDKAIAFALKTKD
jgi:class 3 adenylate cyclase